MQTTLEATQEVLDTFVGGEIIFCNDSGGSPYLHKGTLTDIKVGAEYTQAFVNITQSAIGKLEDRDTAKWTNVSGRGSSSVVLRNPAAIPNDNTVVFETPTDRGSTAIITRAQ